MTRSILFPPASRVTARTRPSSRRARAALRVIGRCNHPATHDMWVILGRRVASWNPPDATRAFGRPLGRTRPKDCPRRERVRVDSNLGLRRLLKLDQQVAPVLQLKRGVVGSTIREVGSKLA